jgi:hypothetical protein
MSIFYESTGLVNSHQGPVQHLEHPLVFEVYYRSQLEGQVLQQRTGL